MYKSLSLLIIKLLLDIVKPLEPLTTSDHEEPPFTEYCHLLNETFCKTNVSVIVLGVNVKPPSVDLKI